MKMTKSKRLLALLLVLCMTLSCALALSACGGEPSGGETKDTSDTSETGDPTPTWSDYGTTPLAPTGVTRGSFDRSKFHIGTYCFYSGTRTEEMFKALHDCGVDFSALERFAGGREQFFIENDIGAFVYGPYGDDYPEWFESPACVAYDLKDEPSALLFDSLGEQVVKLEEQYPNLLIYINLLPSYASKGQLGGVYYGKYIEEYVQKVPTDYISYDNYPFSLGDATSWYRNLMIVGDACTKNDRSLWVIAQGYGDDGHGVYLKPGQMRVQAYTAMAFGAEMINWAGWAAGWGAAFPEENGELTPLYDTWKEVNTEILGMADEFMKYRRMNTSFVGFNPNSRAGIDIWGIVDPTEVLNAGVFADFKINDTDKSLVVGEMAPRNGDGSSALMIAEATMFDGSNKASFEVTFKTIDSRTVKAYQGKNVTELTPDADGAYHLTVNPYAGILLVAERK